MTAKMSQKEYLKKYLSGGSDKRKKKKDKKAKSKATVNIIDDDVYGDNNLNIDEELLLTGEDAPQIVGVIDASGSTADSKWKSISGIKEEEKTPNHSNEDDLWGKKATSRTSSDRWQQPESRRTVQQSPARKYSNGRHGDQSPPRNRPEARVRRSSDQSPPRRRPQTRRDSDQSPPRKRSPRARKNSDQSPPRKRAIESHQRSGSRHSPARIKREKSSDQSPPRRRNIVNPFKSSPSQHRDSDQSPPRIKREPNSESPPPTHKPSSKMAKTLDGKRAGLQDAKTLKLETEERRRKEDKIFSKMSNEISGRDAEVQVRQSSSYRRRRKDLEEDPEVQRKKAAHEQQKRELYDRWNKGLKQIEAHQAKASDDQYESTKPLARYSDDVDLDEMLKQKERDDDPMLEYMRSKKKDQQRAKNIPVMPKYKGSFPENRFGIPPGYRWDGVDRSNGYEKKWFDVQSKKKALADESYKYSTEDM